MTFIENESEPAPDPNDAIKILSPGFALSRTAAKLNKEAAENAFPILFTINPNLIASLSKPKDLAAFIKIAEELGYDFELLKVVQKINENQRDQIVKKLKNAIPNLDSRTVGIWGFPLSQIQMI